MAGLVAVLLVGAGGAGYAWHRSGSSGAGNAASVSLTAPASASPSGVAPSSGGVSPSGTPSAPLAVLVPTLAAKDSGVALCAEIRDTNGKPAVPPGAGGPGVDANTARYRYLRKKFADSRYADIRKAGTGFLDTVALMPTPTGTDPLQIAKDLGTKMVTAYAALSAACANHGVKLPAMTGG